VSLILIMEDSRAMAEAAREKLKEAGHEAVVCFGATDGLSACLEHRPALVLSEYYLQDGTGLDFMRKMDKLESPPPVIMVTGCGQEEVAAEAMSLGALAYRLKTGAYLDELPQLVDRHLSEWKERQSRKEKEQLQRRLESQNELAGWLAHNFKNILAASIGYLNLVDLNNPGQNRAKQLEYLTDSRKSQESAIHLLEQLIRLTEADKGDAEMITVGEVVDEAWDTAKSKVLTATAENYPQRLEETRARIDKVIFLNSTRRLEPLNIVRADLSSILEALLQNALEATLSTEEPRILVAGELKDRLSLIVKDNGRGMSENVLRHALEPLFSTKGEVGVGLSLSLVSSLVLRHGGELKIDSKPGLGTTVSLEFHL